MWFLVARETIEMLGHVYWVSSGHLGHSLGIEIIVLEDKRRVIIPQPGQISPRLEDYIDGIYKVCYHVGHHKLGEVYKIKWWLLRNPIPHKQVIQDWAKKELEK